MEDGNVRRCRQCQNVIRIEEPQFASFVTLAAWRDGFCRAACSYAHVGELVHKNEAWWQRNDRKEK